ncbi:MAG TPA: hypothetical protein PKA53_08120 [Sphingobacterium sp.]|nr:hypothetical protein [Sphingobacterium sp.]
MVYHEQLLATLQSVSPQQAEIMEEEINIMIHKLKFLPKENFPTVTVCPQNNGFAPVFSESLSEKVKIAGGQLISDIEEKPKVIIILKSDDSLYSDLPTLLEQEWLQETPAYRNNRLFIIEIHDFGKDADFLKETEILAEILQPKYFYFGHEGDGWIRFDLVHS